jgi:hypothetical protein
MHVFSHACVYSRRGREVDVGVLSAVANERIAGRLGS